MDRSPQRVEIVVPVRTLLVLLGFAVLVVLAVLSLGTLLSIFVAAVIALGLDPLVGALVRRGWGRGRAALAVFAGLFAAVFVIVLVDGRPAVGARSSSSSTSCRRTGTSSPSSDVFEEHHLDGRAPTTRSASALKDLAAGLPDAASALLGIAGGVFGSVLSLVTLTFLALFLLMERPTITDWLFGFAAAARSSAAGGPSSRSRSAPSRRRCSATSRSRSSPATVAGLSAWALGLPFPIVLAVITGLLDLIPQVGATIAAVILVAVALTVSTTAAVVMLVIQLIYQQVENYIVYPIVYRRAVELSAFTTIVAVLIAGALLGVVGRDPRRAVRRRDQDRAARGRRARGGRGWRRCAHAQASEP